MIETLDRMGIRPQERRSVILLLLAFLIIGNIAWLMDCVGRWLLQPSFGISLYIVWEESRRFNFGESAV